MAIASQRRRAYPPIGKHLRAERSARGLSLRDLADRLGVSASLISQIETGRARPSVSTLYALANELGISLDEILFLDTDRETVPAKDGAEQSNGMPSLNGTGQIHVGPVQRAYDRKRIRLASGVEWERLTTTSEAGTEFLLVSYEVGGASSPANEFQRHAGREWGYVLSGTLGVTIAFDDHQLGPGDSVALDSTIPHRLYNRGMTPVRAIWFVAGRTSSPGAGPAQWDHPAKEPGGPQPVAD